MANGLYIFSITIIYRSINVNCMKKNITSSTHSKTECVALPEMPEDFKKTERGSPVKRMKDTFANFIGKGNSTRRTPEPILKHPPGVKRLLGDDAKQVPHDINPLAERLSDLEEHVIDLHSAFDDFVLQADKYMNYEQFVEMRREIEEKMRALDKIESSLEESRNQILKDSGYMDSILGGFKYTKKRIEILEKRMGSIEKSGGQGSRGNVLGRFLGGTHLKGAGQGNGAEFKEMKKRMDEICRQMESIKKCEEEAGKVVEKLKETGLNMQKKDDARTDNMDEIVGKCVDDKIKLMMDDVKKMDAQIHALREQQGKGVGDEELLKIVNEKEKKEDEGIAETRGKIKALEKKMDSLVKNGGSENRGGGILNKFLGAAQVKGAEQGKGANKEMKKRIDEICRQMESVKKCEEETKKDVEIVKSILPEENKGIEDEIVKKSDVDAKIKSAVSEAVKDMDARVDALGKQSSGDDWSAKFSKSHEEMKMEISRLKKDIEGMCAKMDSLQEKNHSDERFTGMQNMDSMRDEDISEIRCNIEKLKAMSNAL